MVDLYISYNSFTEKNLGQWWGICRQDKYLEVHLELVF